MSGTSDRKRCKKYYLHPEKPCKIIFITKRTFNMNSRRKFLYNSSALMAGGMLASSLNNNAFAIFKNRISPNDQINVGSIGIKGMGWADTNAALKIPGVNLVAICDVDQSVIDQRKGD